jgi:WD40 repeat protein
LPIAEFFDHEEPVQCVSLSNDSHMAITGAGDGTVIVYDLRFDGPVETVRASPTGA